MATVKYWYHESAIIDNGATLGEGTQVWHFSHVCSEALIGERCSLGQNVFIGNRVVIGNRCKIQNNVSIYDNVTLEDDVFCGPSMVFTNVYNPRAAIIRKEEYRSTLIRIPQHPNPQRSNSGSQLHCGLRSHNRALCLHWSWSAGLNA